MLPLRHPNRWRVASAVLLFLVLTFTLAPVVWFWSDRSYFVDWFFGIDKMLHGVTFTLLAIWFAGQYRPRSYWRIGIGLIAFGLLIEACQRLVTYRSAEWFDVAADSAGIIIGLTIASAGVGGWGLRFEDWYSRRTAGAEL